MSDGQQRRFYVMWYAGWRLLTGLLQTGECEIWEYHMLLADLLRVKDWS
jgi:hypothetical protein